MKWHNNKKVQLTIRLALPLSLVLGISGTLFADCNQPPSSQPVPCGFVDMPINNSTSLQGAINVTGWTLSQYGGISVTVYRNPLLGEATQPNGLVLIGGAPIIAHARPDVASHYPGYPQNDYGWGMQILTNLLPGTNGNSVGNGTYTLHIIATDANSISSDFQVTISTDNAHATKPFGTIDTPGQSPGQNVVSGFAYVNFGWALTPQPYMIPTDGSTIDVVLDGVVSGHPVYNNYRSDIANIFPNYANSMGAVGYIYLNTTPLENKLHAISWNVYDTAGRSEGIGSRYFSVDNTAPPMDWDHFRSCVETYTTVYTVCQLQSRAAPYLIPPYPGAPSTLIVRGSNKVISGTVVSSRADTTLQRADANLLYMIQLDYGARNITIQDMTINGNRSLVGSTYPTITYSPYSYIDVDLSDSSNTSNVGAVGTDFENSPGFALTIGSTQTFVNHCTFTGGFLAGVVYGNNGATNLSLFTNIFQNYGGAGVSLGGVTNVTIDNNQFLSNGGEFPDRTGCSGAPCPLGQLVLFLTTNGITVTGNMFVGGHVNGCSVGNCSLFTHGIEGYGFNHTLRRNTFQDHNGAGVSYTGINGLTIQQNVSQNNGFDGIEIVNRPEIQHRCSQNITITGTTSSGNGRYQLDINALGYGPITNVNLGNDNILTNNGFGPLFTNYGSGPCP